MVVIIGLIIITAVVLGPIIYGAITHDPAAYDRLHAEQSARRTQWYRERQAIERRILAEKPKAE